MAMAVSSLLFPKGDFKKNERAFIQKFFRARRKHRKGAVQELLFVGKAQNDLFYYAYFVASFVYHFL